MNIQGVCIIWIQLLIIQDGMHYRIIILLNVVESVGFPSRIQNSRDDFMPAS